MSRNNHIKKVFHAELSGEIIKKVLKMSVTAEKPELEDIGGKGSEKRCQPGEQQLEDMVDRGSKRSMIEELKQVAVGHEERIGEGIYPRWVQCRRKGRLQAYIVARGFSSAL